MSNRAIAIVGIGAALAALAAAAFWLAIARGGAGAGSGANPNDPRDARAAAAEGARGAPPRAAESAPAAPADDTTQRSDAHAATFDGIVFGRLLDDDGHSLAGWRVFFGTRDPELDVAGTTTPAGEFSFRAARGHIYHLSAAPPECPREVESAAVNDVTVTDREVVIRVPADKLPSSRIVGSVVDSAGFPVAGAVLVVFFTKDVFKFAPPSDVAGRIDYSPLPPGAYGLLLKLPTGHILPLARVETKPGAAADLGAIRIPTFGAIEVQLSYASASMPLIEAGATVAEVVALGDAAASIPYAFRRPLRAVFDGASCVVRDLLPGRYALHFSIPHAMVELRYADVRAGEIATVAVTFRPAERRSILIRTAEESDANEPLAVTILDSQGNAVFDSASADAPRTAGLLLVLLAPERYRFLVKARSGRSADVTLDFAAAPPPGGFYEIDVK